jgi:DNA-binding transcriptional LysR family regulator
MHLDFHGLEAFVAIAERGSFRAAAAHLNLSQTALSHRMRKFEDGTGVALLSRTTRQVALTAAGAELLPRARRLLDDMAAASERIQALAMQGEPRLAFGCLPTIATVCLPSVMNRFRETYPDMQVRVFDDSASELADRVQSGDAAFAITVVAANRWNLDLAPLVKEPFVLLCSRKSPMARKSVLNWADIVDLPLIRISTETGNRILIDDALGNRREALNWRYEVQRVTTAVALVASGVGYAVLPKLAARTGVSDELATVSLVLPTVTRTLGVVTRKGEAMSTAARHLLELIQNSLQRDIGHQSINEQSA